MYFDVTLILIRGNILSPTFACVSDINECNSGEHNCDANSKCVNTNGSFTCTCNMGYSGDGVNCDGK